MSPERVIETTIGLFDDDGVQPGQRPPVLAAEIVQALRGAGYQIVPPLDMYAIAGEDRS